MDIKELSGEGKFLFCAMMKSAITMKELGKNKNDFILFASECWVSMEMNDIKELKIALQEQMKQDLISAGLL